jgi:hypothetical protein
VAKRDESKPKGTVKNGQYIIAQKVGARSGKTVQIVSVGRSSQKTKAALNEAVSVHRNALIRLADR